MVSPKASASATASNTTFTKCNWCVSNYSFEVVATGLAKAGSTQYVYILNFNNNEIKKYRVRQGRLANGHVGEPQVRLLSVESTVKNTFNAMVVERDIFDYTVDVPVGIAGSVYDLVGRPYLVNDISDFYNQTLSNSTAVFNYISLGSSLLGKLAGVNYVMDLSFSDGSTASFELTGVSPDGDFTFVFQSAKDIDNNDITIEGFAEVEYSFETQGDAGISSFVSAARRSGSVVSVAYISSIASSASSAGWVCTFKNNTLNCKRV